MAESIVKAVEGRCVHFTGIANKCCGAGIQYADVTRGRSSPCLAQYNPDGLTCDRLEWPSPEQVAAWRAHVDRRNDLRAQGLSGCCEAPFDESAVIKEGRHKGHGTYRCSRCGQVAFVV